MNKSAEGPETSGATEPFKAEIPPKDSSAKNVDVLAEEKKIETRCVLFDDDTSVETLMEESFGDVELSDENLMIILKTLLKLRKTKLLSRTLQELRARKWCHWQTGMDFIQANFEQLFAEAKKIQDIECLTTLAICIGCDGGYGREKKVEEIVKYLFEIGGKGEIVGLATFHPYRFVGSVRGGHINFGHPGDLDKFSSIKMPAYQCILSHIEDFAGYPQVLFMVTRYADDEQKVSFAFNKLVEEKEWDWARRARDKITHGKIQRNEELRELIFIATHNKDSVQAEFAIDKLITTKAWDALASVRQKDDTPQERRHAIERILEEHIEELTYSALENVALFGFDISKRIRAVEKLSEDLLNKYILMDMAIGGRWDEVSAGPRYKNEEVMKAAQKAVEIVKIMEERESK